MMRECAEFVVQFEGFEARPYLCPAGVWTIGYGTTYYPDGTKVSCLDTPCTQEEAMEWLGYELEDLRRFVLSKCKPELTEYQLIALISFVYNVGRGAFSRSTLLKRVNSLDFSDVPHEMSRWDKSSGKVLGGLVARRRKEAEMWLRSTHV